MKPIAYKKAAIKTLSRMPADMSALVRSKIEQHAREPESLSANVVKLQGREGYRLRVGDWRVIFSEDKVVLTVLQVGPRGGVYD
jgi:mRNA interferase RelE/StbE